ncbi:acidic leucine-rich nuclear phosphoprotein 32 family member B-like [Neltuma alba]|uniref:acidic leucine-rich nuclear phosphoprotein 32 family member B-like n=1 Tax=Neltuma alba TaxID=207710 RepID=UPI0010A4EDF5|nr:acidic leucine-rich nuclear phosphoprotein 32 family member B-like [Prosopis alba]
MGRGALFFGEHFNLIQGSPRGSTSAIQYWIDEKIKELASTERKSIRGLLYGEKGSDVVSSKDKRINIDSLDPNTGETSEAVQKNDGGRDGESSEGKEKEKDDEGSDDETSKEEEEDKEKGDRGSDDETSEEENK